MKTAIALCLVFLSSQTLYADILEGDRLFAERSNGLATVEAAHAEYAEVRAGASGDELAYIVQQIGRLANFRGHYIAGLRRPELTEIFQDCRETTELLAPAREQYRDFYSYWQMSCTAQFMKYAPLSLRIREVPIVKANFNEVVGEDLEIRPELGLDTRYQGAGLYRTLAALYANSLSGLIRDDLPNYEKALEFIRRAIDSTPYPGEGYWGYEFYRNHRIQAEILIEMEDEQEAAIVLEDAIEEIQELIEDDDLPAGLEPETIGEKQIMERMLDSL